MAKHKKIAGIIQARLGSTRLPNKVLMSLPKGSSVTVLERVIQAVRGAELIDEVIVTTPDVKIATVVLNSGVRAFLYEGERDCIAEYVKVGRGFDIVVRITADCPLLDSKIIDNCIQVYLDSNVDLVYNTDCRNNDMAGDGQDVEVFSYEALERADANAEERFDVCSWMKDNLNSKRVAPPDYETCSLDTYSDYLRILELYEKGKVMA